MPLRVLSNQGVHILPVWISSYYILQSRMAMNNMNHSFHNLTKAPATSRAQPTVAAPSESKPKKPNSEVRKQQNRIASRNYREKRKRKLQQLQQLLDDGDDDNSSEARGQTRSVSPYEDRSCSGSATYERSVASVSPHITATPGHLNSPQPEYTLHATPAWTAPNPLYTQGSLAYPLAYSESQQMIAYDPRENRLEEYATLNANLPDFDPGHATCVSSHDPVISSHASSWTLAGCPNIYVQPQHQQQAFATHQASPWQHHMMEGSARVDPYERRYRSYEPQ